MRTIVLAAACAIGLGFAAGGASAAPLASGLDNVGNASLIQQVQWRGRPRCRMVTRCFRNRWGRRICRTERICRRW